MSKKKTSEFGKGFVYNLILFAKHYENIIKEVEMRDKQKELIGEVLTNPYSNWFYKATDHLYDVEIPEQWKRTKIARLTKELIEICFNSLKKSIS